MWVVLLPNDVLTVTILPESLYEALVILPPYTSVISFQAPRTHFAAAPSAQN